jgi:hypothetical protein
MVGERTGVLVVRVWTEPGAPEPRARLIETSGVEGVGSSTVAAGVDAICAAVRAWLEPFAGGDAPVTDG